MALSPCATVPHCARAAVLSLEAAGEEGTGVLPGGASGAPSWGSIPAGWRKAFLLPGSLLWGQKCMGAVVPGGVGSLHVAPLWGWWC